MLIKLTEQKNYRILLQATEENIAMTAIYAFIGEFTGHVEGLIHNSIPYYINVNTRESLQNYVDSILETDIIPKYEQLKEYYGCNKEFLKWCELLLKEYWVYEDIILTKEFYNKLNNRLFSETITGD